MATSGLISHSGNDHHLSELRIVLLGWRYAGKSSAGNTILGREEFGSCGYVHCVKRQGEVAGRQVTVVEAPGWCKHPVEFTPELVKQEIVLSVSLCPPGPHTLLLVIPVDTSFTETNRRAVEEHMKLLSERVWSHAIVLFTSGDRLGDTTIEQHIESEGTLQWLVEKCGNRYHVLNNENRGDGTQVTELLEKMEEMVGGHSGCHCEIDREILQEVGERRRAEEERARERMMVQKQRENLRSLKGDAHHLSGLRIVLLGWRYAGKGSAGNTILGREEFDTTGTTAQCVKRQGEVAGRQLTVVDTPGWRKFPLEFTPELVKQEIVLSVSLCPPGPHTLLLVIPVDTSFTGTERRTVEEHMKLLSERVWFHAIVLFTWGDRLGDTTIEQHIESERTLQWLVEKCWNRYHVLNNENRGDGTQVTELLEKMEEMVRGNSGYHYEIDRERLQEVGERRRAKEKRAKKWMLNLKKRRGSLSSLEVSGEGSSDPWSMSSSGYDSLLSLQGSGASSKHGSSLSITSSTSSGIGSQSSNAESVRSSGSRWIHLTKFLRRRPYLATVSQSPQDKLTEDRRPTAVEQGQVSGEGSSDPWSMSSSGYDSLLSLQGSGASSKLGSSLSITSSTSSGIGSQSSNAESVRSSGSSWIHLTKFLRRRPYLGTVSESPQDKLTEDSTQTAVEQGQGWNQGTAAAVKTMPVEECPSDTQELHATIDKAAPRIFRTYLFPCDATLIDAVKNEERSDGKRILKPKPERSLLKNNWYSLTTSPPFRITPDQIQLRDCTTTPNFFELKDLRKSETDFKMELISFSNNVPVWKADVEEYELSLTATVDPSRTSMPYGSRFVKMHRAALIKRVSNVMSIADLMLDKDLITNEQYSEIRAVSTSENKMREIYKVLRRAGPEENAEFYKILHSEQRLLVEDLAKSGL